jgi:hypothetical protein
MLWLVISNSLWYMNFIFSYVSGIDLNNQKSLNNWPDTDYILFHTCYAQFLHHVTLSCTPLDRRQDTNAQNLFLVHCEFYVWCNKVCITFCLCVWECGVFSQPFLFWPLRLAVHLQLQSRSWNSNTVTCTGEMPLFYQLLKRMSYSDYVGKSTVSPQKELGWVPKVCDIKSILSEFNRMTLIL